MEAEKYTYLYPIYFDAEKTCAEGRRIPSSLCKKNPQARDILKAAQSSDLVAELEQEKSHPRSLVGSGRVKVLKSLPKNQVLLKIAALLPAVSSSNNTQQTSNNSTSKTSNSASTSVEIAPNVVYQVRSKKNKKNK